MVSGRIDDVTMCIYEWALQVRWQHEEDQEECNSCKQRFSAVGRRKVCVLSCVFQKLNLFILVIVFAVALITNYLYVLFVLWHQT